MRYYDALYGFEWELPKIVERLIHTKEMVRLRNITQGVMPNNLNVRGPLPSRFQHSMGVCYLAREVLRVNQQGQKDFENLLMVSALLHDAGNPPFSHLSEPFLKEVTGHDGESFLQEVLDGSETEKILNECGIHTETVVKMVTGNWKPFSDVLNGSMDIDNLDNVARHAKYTNLPARFSPLTLAHSFRFGTETCCGHPEWFILPSSTLRSAIFLEMQSWKNSRAQVYNQIYSSPHLNMAMMLQRAVQLAFSEGELDKNFFFLDDYSAFLLLKACNIMTSTLIHRLVRWEYYDEVVSLDFEDPSEKIKSLAKGWSGRATVADRLAEKLKIPKEDICVLISKGKDKRRVTLPFLYEGQMHFDKEPDNPIYRVRVYLRRWMEVSRFLVNDLLQEEIS